MFYLKSKDTGIRLQTVKKLHVVGKLICYVEILNLYIYCEKRFDGFHSYYEILLP